MNKASTVRPSVDVHHMYTGRNGAGNTESAFLWCNGSVDLCVVSRCSGIAIHSITFRQRPPLSLAQQQQKMHKLLVEFPAMCL